MLASAMALDTAAASPAPVGMDEDHALVRAAGQGDTKAFEQLYRKHARRTYAAVWRLSGGQAARAEDLVQDAFVRAWQALPGFRFESAFSTWLHRLAINTALMSLRSRSGAEDLETDDAALFQQWALHWRGTGASFEVVPVTPSAAARGAAEARIAQEDGA